jgi:hypothetical protein
MDGSWLFNGEDVTVELKRPTVCDGFNKQEYDTEAVTVADVLVAPGATADVTDSNRPEGVRVAYTLYFPKSFAAVLDGLHVIVRGERCAVIGAPRPYPESLTPGKWNLKAEVEAVHG